MGSAIPCPTRPQEQVDRSLRREVGKKREKETGERERRKREKERRGKRER